MPNTTNIDPLEGKGEEMVPEKGLPFDDIDETPLEDIPPEERIPDYPQGDLPAVELDITPEDNFEYGSENETEIVVEATDNPSFEISAAETEAIIGDAEDAFDMEATPWTMEDEEVVTFIGKADEVFTPTDAFDMPAEDVNPIEATDKTPLEDEFEAPPIDFADEGMSTHREDTKEPLIAEPSIQLPAAIALTSVHKHANIHHSEQTAIQSMVDLLVSDDAMQALWQRADQAQKDIKRHILSLNIARPMLDQIQAGRNELMAGKEYYEEAERHIAEAEYRVQLSIQLEKWSRTLIPRLFFYLAAWFVILIVAIFIIGENLFATNTPLLAILAGSMIFGGIGGIIGAVLPLIKHISEDQDFSKRYTSWYVYSPFIGVAMGTIIFVILSAGVLSISAGSSSITLPYIIYIVAGLAGYQHNVFTELAKRMLKVLQIGKDDMAEPPTTTETQQPFDKNLP